MGGPCPRPGSGVGGWVILSVALLLRAVQVREPRSRKRGSNINWDKGVRLMGKGIGILRPWISFLSMERLGIWSLQTHSLSWPRNSS